jgi:hypothetical protein
MVRMMMTMMIMMMGRVIVVMILRKTRVIKLFDKEKSTVAPDDSTIWIVSVIWCRILYHNNDDGESDCGYDFEENEGHRAI